MPLETLVVPKLRPVTLDGAVVHVDASPWGCGAVRFDSKLPVEIMIVTWDASTAAYLGEEIGKPDGQTTWELLALLLCLVAWAAEHRAAGLALLGDNVAALSAALNLKGRKGLTKINREISWRKCHGSWRYAAGHLPSEQNVWADALSRTMAPEGSDHKQIPEALLQTPRREPPVLDDLWSFRDAK